MTPEERDIINDLFQRLRDFGVPEKDPQADALINQSVRALPDSAYLLVQTLLVREQELQQAEERVQELEDQIAQSQPAPAQAGTGGGSFLGGRGGQQSARGGSVPSMGGGSQNRADASGSPWGPATSQQAPAHQAPMQQAPMQQAPQEQHKSGGGFFKTALTAAAGMAGGVMMADSIKGMMGGGQHGSGHGSKTASSEAESEHALHRKPADQASLAGDGNDPGTYDANASEDDGIFDDSGSGGGGSSDE